MVRHAELAEVQLPEFGTPTVEPTIPAETYLDRIETLREKARGKSFDSFVVYGDREQEVQLADFWVVVQN